MASVTATQQRNEVEVLGEVFYMVSEASYLKTPQEDIGRLDCAAQAVHYTMIYLHHRYNLTHN